jgi:hypothetical protein
VQRDGFVLNLELFHIDWFNLDYIGSPWPAFFRGEGVNQIGNGGFSLRSRKLMKEVSKIDLSYFPNEPEDNIICLKAYPYLIDLGFKFASLKEAAKFGVEWLLPETPLKTFGFHGKVNHRTQSYCNLLNE